MSRLINMPPESLCLLRLSAIGDVTHMVPIIHTLRTYWPATRLSWIIGQQEAGLIDGLPGVELIPFNKDSGLQGIRELYRRLQGRRFDALLHMQVSLRANLVSALVRTPIRVGFDRARAKDLHGAFVNRRIPAGEQQHVLDGFFDFLEMMGLTERVLDWSIPIPAEARAFAEHHLPGTQPTLVISPCSQHQSRNWIPAYYAEVADYAIQHLRMRVVLCGGPSRMERDYGEAIEARMQNPALNLIGRDTLKRLLALLARTTVLLCPDSGPAHMATCVDTPVIGLYAASNPLRSGPYRSRHWCADRYAEAARTYLGKSPAGLAWGTKIEVPGVMDLIPSSAVIERLAAFMQTHDDMSKAR